MRLILVGRECSFGPKTEGERATGPTSLYVIECEFICVHAVTLGKGKSVPQPSPRYDYVVAQGQRRISGSVELDQACREWDEGPELLGAQGDPLPLQLRLSE